MGVALITGASSGLGVEFAKLFARDGHALVLVARRRRALEHHASALRTSNPNLRVYIFDHDLGLPGAGKALFEKMNDMSVDFLVNNAGFGLSGDFVELPLDRQLQMSDLNVRTIVELTHLFLPGMLARNSGAVLNIGSMAGFQPGPFMSTYYASKAFVNSFSEALHDELNGTGVSCTVLAPGATATEFAEAAGARTSSLFKSRGVASALEVAEIGYKAMQSRRALVVPGLRNNLLLQMLLLSPRFMVRKATAMLNRVPLAKR
jgi:short-subunit dehydrogenase